jgi:hypothetical protein
LFYIDFFFSWLNIIFFSTNSTSYSWWKNGNKYLNGMLLKDGKIIRLIIFHTLAKVPLPFQAASAFATKKAASGFWTFRGKLPFTSHESRSLLSLGLIKLFELLSPVNIHKTSAPLWRLNFWHYQSSIQFLLSFFHATGDQIVSHLLYLSVPFLHNDEEREFLQTDPVLVLLLILRPVWLELLIRSKLDPSFIFLFSWMCLVPL